MVDMSKKLRKELEILTQHKVRTMDHKTKHWLIEVVKEPDFTKSNMASLDFDNGEPLCNDPKSC